MPLTASALLLLLQGPLLPPLEALAGRFTNPGGPVLTALEIQLKPSAVVHAWGKCEPADCDWGTADADLYRADRPLSRGGPVLSAVFVRDSVEHRLVVRAASQGRLAVELLARFPDDSSKNFSAVTVLAREGVRLAPTPRGLRPLRVGGSIREPAKLKDVRPVYPEAAKRDRIQGLIVLECTIGPDGSVVETRPLRGEAPELIDAAIEAVRQWRYAPTFVDGVAVPVIMTVTVNFKLS